MLQCSCRALRCLRCSCCTVTPRLCILQALSLASSTTVDGAVAELAAATGLTSLDLSGCRYITPKCGLAVTWMAVGFVPPVPRLQGFTVAVPPGAPCHEQECALAA